MPCHGCNSRRTPILRQPLRSSTSYVVCPRWSSPENAMTFVPILRQWLTARRFCCKAAIVLRLLQE